jgi:transposase
MAINLDSNIKTSSDYVISILKQILRGKRIWVKGVTLDMAGSMNLIVEESFPRAVRVIDRFHIQKLAYDTLQEMRIAHRWDAINEEKNGKASVKNARASRENTGESLQHA